MRLSALEKKATSKSYRLYVAIVVMFNILPHCFTLPAWLIVIAAIFIIWSILNIYRNYKLPSVLFRNTLIAISSAFIFMKYKTLFGAEPAAALFVVVAAVKLVDFTKYRDGMTEIILCYFLLLTHLLHSQSLATTLFFTVDVFVITTLMHQLHKNDRRQSIRTFLPSLKMLFLTIPIWIFLFLVFPRFSASLIHVKPPQPTTGFSEKLVPGTISQLIQTDETAFRVKFDREISNDDMYFRGAILSKSEGLNWRKSESDDVIPESKRLNDKIQIEKSLTKMTKQEIVIEPNFQKYLFALDYPNQISTPDGQALVQKAGKVFELKEPLHNRTLYNAESLNMNDEFLSSEDRENYLVIPEVSTRVVQLASELELNTKTTQQKISKILNYFTSKRFYYSLNPGQMPGDALNVFLFERRIGFCEHFAASFSTLMRLMKVPSRVVIGFQGGKLNKLTGYYLVKTLDAHAWSEVWSDDERRWIRVDPTAVIEPIRISFGAETYREGLNRSSVFDAKNSLSHAINTNVFFAIDAITTKWNNFLLKYDFEYQNKILEELGFSNSSRMTLFILLFAGLAALTAALKIYFSTQKSKTDPVLGLYHSFCKKLESLGVTRNKNEGPQTLLLRATDLVPQRRNEIESIINRFIEIRYKNQGDRTDVKQFKVLVNKF